MCNREALEGSFWLAKKANFTMTLPAADNYALLLRHIWRHFNQDFFNSPLTITVKIKVKGQILISD